MKMWTGRFKKPTDSIADDFNSSLPFDSRMYKQDIEGSIAHATMLGETGIIEKAEAASIITGLESILDDIEDGTLAFDPAAEDIHMFIEEELTKRIGSAGKRLHTARSRNDQVALDIRMYMHEEGTAIKNLLVELIQTLCHKAEENIHTIMCGYTHLQRAQPVTFAHHLMAYAQMFRRDIGRLADAAKRMDEMPLGSGALAGTTYNIDRHMVAKQLGFAALTANSLDAVADRDFLVEIAAALSLVMTHLSRFAEEIIMWCSWEFRYIELDDAFATGSSIMPQKKNPDIAELVRGKTARVYSDLITLLTMLKGLPLAYNKDMQEDKEAIFDAVDTVKMCLRAFTPMIATMTVQKENMRQAAAAGFINATDCADFLAKKGLPFREAYQITGELVAYCIENNLVLETLPLEAYKNYCELFDKDIYEAINLENCVAERKVVGGSAPESVLAQIEDMKGVIYFCGT
jgi:argininosuccinate lyase